MINPGKYSRGIVTSVILVNDTMLCPRDGSILISPEETGKSYPTTTIRVKPNQTPVSSDETQMKNWVENQTDMKDIFQENTYDELKEILQNWLNPSDDTQEESVGIEEDTTETTPEEKSSTTKVTNVSDAFDELFNS